jgi:hypothetical protein
MYRFLDGRKSRHLPYGSRKNIPCSIRVENMNKIWISIILIVSLMGFASAIDGSGVELRPGEATAELLFNYGIGEPWIGGNPPSTSAYNSMYSQYYSFYKGPATAKHIEAPRQYAISDAAPTTVYVGSQMQPMPYPQYYATYTGGNSLWIQGSTSWTQYAKVPQGSILSLLAISPKGGEGYLYETYPDGKVSRSDFYFYPTSRIGFYADTPGRHVLSFVLAGQPSNQVVIDVVSTYKPPSYYTPPSYYSGYYPYNWDYYPHYWGYYLTYGDDHQGGWDGHQGEGDSHQGAWDGYQRDHQGEDPGLNPHPAGNPPPADMDGHQYDGTKQYEKPGLGPKDKSFPNAVGLYMNNPQRFANARDIGLSGQDWISLQLGYSEQGETSEPIRVGEGNSLISANAKI